MCEIKAHRVTNPLEWLRISQFVLNSHSVLRHEVLFV